jgi:hypothetical protein
VRQRFDRVPVRLRVVSGVLTWALSLQKPQWQPPSLDEVRAEDVDKCFAAFDSQQDEIQF